MHSILLREGVIWRLSSLQHRTKVGSLSPPNIHRPPSRYEHYQSPDTHQSKHSACTRPCYDHPLGTEKPLPRPAENSYKTAHKEFSLYNLYYQDMPPITVQGRDPE